MMSDETELRALVELSLNLLTVRTGIYQLLVVGSDPNHRGKGRVRARRRAPGQHTKTDRYEGVWETNEEVRKKGKRMTN